MKHKDSADVEEVVVKCVVGWERGCAYLAVPVRSVVAQVFGRQVD